MPLLFESSTSIEPPCHGWSVGRRDFLLLDACCNDTSVSSLAQDIDKKWLSRPNPLAIFKPRETFSEDDERAKCHTGQMRRRQKSQEARWNAWSSRLPVERCFDQGFQLDRSAIHQTPSCSGKWQQPSRRTDDKVVKLVN